MGNHAEYKFSTFQEAYEQIPAEKLEEAFRQIGVSLAAAKHLDLLRIEITKSQYGADEKFLALKMPLGWVDDDMCNIKVKMGELIYEAKSKAKG